MAPQGAPLVLSGGGGSVGSQGGEAGRGDALMAGWHPARRRGVSRHCGRQPWSPIRQLGDAARIEEGLFKVKCRI